MDIRPVLDGPFYPSYVDGSGWKDEGERDDGYCPVCNIKNYVKWKKKMAKEEEDNRIEKKKVQEEHERKLKVNSDDIARAASMVFKMNTL